MEPIIIASTTIIPIIISSVISIYFCSSPKIQYYSGERRRKEAIGNSRFGNGNSRFGNGNSHFQKYSYTFPLGSYFAEKFFNE
jgi:hypothetical protein